MSKQKIVVSIAVLLSLILLFFLAKGIFWGEGDMNKMKNEEQMEMNKEKAVMEKIKEGVCSEENNPLGVSDINNILSDSINQETVLSLFSKEEKADLQGYYFCDGFLKNDVTESCGNILKDKEKFDQCKNNFNFFQMIFASLDGEKIKAEEICKKDVEGGVLCNLIGSLQEFKEQDSCSQAMEKGKPFCYAFFTGNGELCEKGENVENCKRAASFLEILSSQNENNCDALFSYDESDNQDIFCRIRLSKNQNICVDYKYKKFIQSFCEKNN